MIAQSAAMKPVMDIIERVAVSEANILILGENGAGKGLVARVIHSLSRRAEKALVTANMGGFPEGVFESEMFGHVKGAFTDARSDRMGRFELADEGTLFLDEIANLSASQQTRLLRVLESGEFERVGSSRSRRTNVRIISATNAGVQAEVAAGRFRQDLLFRLNTIEIQLPPLRRRHEDIPVLASEFLRKHARNYRKSLSSFEPAALEALLNRPWPGNVRELDHVIERAVLMAQGPLVQSNDLGLQAKGSGQVILEDMSLDEVERLLIRKTLARFDGNALKAAEALGLSRSAFYRRLEKHKL
jgi:DNA-binding NtrC family response regulator